MATLKGQKFRLVDGTEVGRLEHHQTAQIFADEFGYLDMATLRQAVFATKFATSAFKLLPEDEFRPIPPGPRDYSDLVFFDIVLEDRAAEDFSTIYLYYLVNSCVIATIYLNYPAVTDRASAESIVGEVASRHGFIIHSMKFYSGSNSGGEPSQWEVCVSINRGSTTSAELFELTYLLQEILRLPVEAAVVSGGKLVQLDWQRACRLIINGFPGYLIGQAENQWLEVKSRGYDCDNFADEVELAQDVARFANGDGPGLLLLGYRTKRVDGLDTIQKIAPIEASSKDCLRYRAVLDRRVFPPISGLRIECIPFRGRAIVAIIVPQQDDAEKPYLVHGAIVGERHEGAFISIVRRRDEHSIPVEPSAIHAALVAGRRVIRGSESA